jgi:hypothetical protein
MENNYYHNFHSSLVKLKPHFSEVIFYGTKYQVESMAFSGFKGDDGFVKIEKSDYLHVYFPLTGMAVLTQENQDKIKLMTSCFSEEDILRKEGKYFLIFDGDKKNTEFFVVLSDKFTRQILVQPIFIEPRITHQISWKKIKDPARPVKGLNPLFLEMVLKEY